MGPELLGLRRGDPQVLTLAPLTCLSWTQTRPMVSRHKPARNELYLGINKIHVKERISTDNFIIADGILNEAKNLTKYIKYLLLKSYTWIIDLSPLLF